MHPSPACHPCLAASAERTQWAGFLPKASGPRRAKAACDLCLVGFSCRLSIPETQAVSTLLGSLWVLRLKYSRTLLCLPHLVTSSAVGHFAAVWLQSDLSLFVCLFLRSFWFLLFVVSLTQISSSCVILIPHLVSQQSFADCPKAFF